MTASRIAPALVILGFVAAFLAATPPVKPVATPPAPVLACAAGAPQIAGCTPKD